MNRISQFTVMAVLALAGAFASAAGDESNPVWRMSTASADGDKSYYTVWCTDKSIGSVIAEHDTKQFCAISQGGKRRCDKQWDLSKAAEQACRKRR